MFQATSSLIFCDSQDLYGRGYTDAPDTPYTAPLYTSQVALVMQHVGWTSARIAGISMVHPLLPFFVINH
jgi:hypothetical protein